MEEKKLNELSDEALDDVAGGYDWKITHISCAGCNKKRISVPRSGYFQVTCPNCGATLIGSDGKIVMCIRKAGSK